MLQLCHALGLLLARPDLPLGDLLLATVVDGLLHDK